MLSFTGLALSSDLENESSKPFSPTAVSSQIEVTNQKPYQDASSEDKVLQTRRSAENSGTSSNKNVFPSRLYHILSDDPDAIKAITSPVAKKEAPVESHQHVTVHPPTANRVSSVPVPEHKQQLRQYVQTAEKPTPIQYSSAPVGYSQVYQNPNQESVTVQQQSGPTITPESQSRPIAPSVGYNTKVIYITIPSGAPQSTLYYPVARKEVPLEDQQSNFVHPSSAPQLSMVSPMFFYNAYQQPQGIVNRFGSQQVSAPTSQTGQYYETVTTKPSSGGYIKHPKTSPSEQQIQTSVPPERVQYILAPIKQVRKNISNPIKTATLEAHKSVVAHPSPTVAPVRNVQVETNSPAAPLIRHFVTFPSMPTLNHHGFPQLHYASSPTMANTVLIPVMYNTESLPALQYVAANEQTQSTQAVVNPQAQVLKPIPIPVVYPNNEGHVYKDRVVGYALATNVLPQQGGYAKPAVFSPASEVSRVRFSGNGIKYEW